MSLSYEAEAKVCQGSILPTPISDADGSTFVS